MRVLIIGSGPCGLTVAETVREHDADCPITMLSAEPFPPYAPPAMADYFLTGRKETLFWKGEDIGERLGIDARMGARVASVRPDASEVSLESGEILGFDRLVIASGSRLYAPLRGHDLDGVYNFKSLTAAKNLVERVEQGEVRSVLIVGAGFIGCEVALLLSDLGVDVTMLELQDRVMPRMLDREMSDIVVSGLRARGVQVKLNTQAAAFGGEREVEGVELSSGELVKADVYIAATGIKPNIDYLEGSGIGLGWGVRVDDHLRTNVADVYAAGDVAETHDRLTGERYVHAIFPNAVTQGRVVGENLLGFDTVYEGAETMNSLKHLGLPVMAVGSMRGDEAIRFQRGDTLRKFYLEKGKLRGFRFAGDIRGAGYYHSLILRETDVSPFKDRLSDPRFGVADRVASLG